MDVAARLEAVEKENDMLRERCAQLEELLGIGLPAPLEFRLTPKETRVFGILMQREVATKDAIMLGLYGGRDADEAEQKIVDVFICKIRAKIKSFDVKIGTVWGNGYFIDAETKKRVRAMLKSSEARAA